MIPVSRALIVIACAAPVSAAAQQPKLIPVRVIKSEERLLDATPEVTCVGDARGCRVSEEYFGNNPTEAYFDVVTPPDLADLPRLRFRWTGATIRRVLVGHTAVEFAADGDARGTGAG